MSIQTPLLNVLDLARELARQFAARADEADRAGKLPPEDVEALKASGYLGISIPREYGGQGLPLRACVAAQLELAQGSTSTALVAGMHIHVLGNLAENRYWPEAMFAQICREAATGGLVNSVASEPILGSPSRGALYETTAVPHPDGGWRINGHKNWATGGRHLTHLLVRLALGDEPAVILAPGAAPGVEWVETWSDSLSLRASDSHDVYFRDVYVPAENLLEQGVKKDRPPEAWFPAIMAAVYLGAALAARDTVIRYTLERVPTALGKPIATLPKIQRQIGEIDVALQVAQSFLLEAAGGWSPDPANRRVQYPRIVAAKHLAIETANDVTDKALRIAGGASISHDLPLERCFRDVRAGLMHPPSGDTALEIIGQGAIDRLNSASR
jgi:alkylation response protein AidB-like acyl-CoA dehydrogenase